MREIFKSCFNKTIERRTIKNKVLKQKLKLREQR